MLGVLAFQAATAHATVAVLVTLLAIAVVPRSWRPGAAAGVLAAGGAFVAIRLGLNQSGLIKWLDHDFLEEIGGEIDELSLWFVGFMGALLVLAAFRYLRR